jgi:hypothetical protein
VTEDQHHKIFILATMSNDGAAEVDPGDNARKFIVDSLGVGAMQHQVLVEKHNKMMSDGNIQMRQGGVAFLSNVVNAGGLAQGLFIVGNLLSQLAASFLCEKVRGVAHRSGKTCINLCGETIDLCTYGKSATLNAAGKCNSNNCLDGNVEPFAVDVDDNSVDESPQLIGVKTLAAPTPRAVVDDVLAGKLDWVWKRAGELAFPSSSPGTAAKAKELYKHIILGNDVITSICRNFPDLLSQEVVTMSMAMMTPLKKKRSL